MLLGIEEIFCELGRDDDREMRDQGLPPGFRFHPTDEELITFYLASKVFNGAFCGVEIAEVDLSRCEPWELPDVAKMGEREWYFFSLRDRKYPTGLRTNRATGAGYWKATGKDREVYSSGAGVGGGSVLIGTKKTLVFYKGRAPRGEKTKWVMHEYRLDGDFSCRHSSMEEWVICRIFHKMGEKKIPTIFEGQSYSIKSSSNSLPPLLEPPQTLLLESPQSRRHQEPPIMQNTNQSTPSPFVGSDIKSLIGPLVSQSGFFAIGLPQPTSPLIGATSNKMMDYSSILFKPPNFLPADQDFTFKELSAVISKHRKKESALDHHHQILNMQLSTERVQEKFTKHQDPFVLSGLHCTSGGETEFMSCDRVGNNIDNSHNVIDVVAIDHVMATEPAFVWW